MSNTLQGAVVLWALPSDIDKTFKPETPRAFNCRKELTGSVFQESAAHLQTHTHKPHTQLKNEMLKAIAAVLQPWGAMKQQMLFCFTL